jgi:hypothetical protein
MKITAEAQRTQRLRRATELTGSVKMLAVEKAREIPHRQFV